MEQRFDGEVSQVAGNNVINQTRIVHIHMAPTASAGVDKAAIHARAVHELLKACDAIDQRKAVERISYKLFGSSLFKKLSLEEIAKLQMIVEEMHTYIHRHDSLLQRLSYFVGRILFARLQRLALWLSLF